MEAQSKAKQILSIVIAIFLWLLTFGLGLEGINVFGKLVGLIVVSFGGDVGTVSAISPWLTFILGILFLLFIIATTEYHLKRIGRRESWRLFGWSIAVEVSIIILYYLL